MADQKPDVLSPLISYLHDHLTAMVREMGADRAVRNPENFIREIDRARAVARGAGILTMEVPHTALLQGVLGEIDDSMERAYSAAGAIAELTSLSFPTESFALPVVELAHRAAQEIEGALEALSVYRNAPWPEQPAGVGSRMEAEYDADGSLVGLRPAPEEAEGEPLTAEEGGPGVAYPLFSEQVETTGSAEAEGARLREFFQAAVAWRNATTLANEERLVEAVDAYEEAVESEAAAARLAPVIAPIGGGPDAGEMEALVRLKDLAATVREWFGPKGQRVLDDTPCANPDHEAVVAYLDDIEDPLKEAEAFIEAQAARRAAHEAQAAWLAAEEQHPAEDVPVPSVETVS